VNVTVQREPFDGAKEYEILTSSGHAAAAVFSGFVRDFGHSGDVAVLELEHYPEMTERVLSEIGAAAVDRFDLLNWRIIHRYGALNAREPIVWVGVTAQHRANAFAACEFIMDYLKTKAPFWKKEISAEGHSLWVNALEQDTERQQRWEETN